MCSRHLTLLLVVIICYYSGWSYSSSGRSWHCGLLRLLLRMNFKLTNSCRVFFGLLCTGFSLFVTLCFLCFACLPVVYLGLLLTRPSFSKLVFTVSLALFFGLLHSFQHFSLCVLFFPFRHVFVSCLAWSLCLTCLYAVLFRPSFSTRFICLLLYFFLLRQL